MSDGAQTLERGLAVLTELARHPAGLTTAEAAAACGLHRSVTNRLLVSLVRSGYAARDTAGRHTVGPTARQVAGAAPDRRNLARPVLEGLARDLDATASLVEVQGEHAVTTVVAEPPTDGPRFTYRLGNRDPLDRGAGGLAAQAALPPYDGEDARVTRTRHDGVVTTHAELHPGAYGIAAPVPGWPGVAVVVVTARPELGEGAREPVRLAAAELGAL